MGCCNLFLPQKNSFSSPYGIFRPKKSYDPLSTPPSPFLPRLIPLQTPFSPSFRLASPNIPRPLANTHTNPFSGTPRTSRTTTRSTRRPLFLFFFFFTSSVSVAAALCSRWRCAFFFFVLFLKKTEKKKNYIKTPRRPPLPRRHSRQTSMTRAQRRAVGPL